MDVAPDNPKYRRPLERSAKAIAADIGADCEVVLLGSIASPKYVDVLGIFGDRLVFPSAFVGRGDMSRGGVAAALRSASARELDYVPVAGAVRHGGRPPKLEYRQRGRSPSFGRFEHLSFTGVQEVRRAFFEKKTPNLLIPV